MAPATSDSCGAGSLSASPQHTREHSPFSSGCLSLPDDMQTQTTDTLCSPQPLYSARSEGPGVVRSPGGGVCGKREKRRYRRGKYRGVRERGPGRWVAEVKDSITGMRRWLGTFPTAEAAALAFDRAVRQIRGETAKTNFPEGASISASSPFVVLGPEGGRIQATCGSNSTSASTSASASASFPTASAPVKQEESWGKQGPRTPPPPPRIALPRASLIPPVGAGFALGGRSPILRGFLPVQGPAAAGARPAPMAIHDTSSARGMAPVGGPTPRLTLHTQVMSHVTSPPLLTCTSASGGGHSMEVDSSSASEGGHRGVDVTGDVRGGEGELEGVDSFVLPVDDEGDAAAFLSIEALGELEGPVLSHGPPLSSQDRTRGDIWFRLATEEDQAHPHPHLGRSTGPAPERLSSAQCDNFSELEGAMWLGAEEERDGNDGAGVGGVPEALLPLALLRPSASISAKAPSAGLVDSFDRAFGSLLAADLEVPEAPPPPLGAASFSSERPGLPPSPADLVRSSSPVVDLGGGWGDGKDCAGSGAGQGLEAGASCSLSLDVIEGLLMNN